MTVKGPILKKTTRRTKRVIKSEPHLTKEEWNDFNWHRITNHRRDWLLKEMLKQMGMKVEESSNGNMRLVEELTLEQEQILLGDGDESS